MKLDELKAHRANAGAAYAAAAETFTSAFVELAALDRVLSNDRLAAGPQLGFGEVPLVPGHGEFLPHPELVAITGYVHDRVTTRADQLLKGI